MAFTKKELEEIRRADREIEKESSYLFDPLNREVDQWLDDAVRHERMLTREYRNYRHRREHNAVYRQAHREEILSYQKQYRRDNLERIRAYDRARYLLRKEYRKDYHAAYYRFHRDRIREKNAAYYAANREKIRARQAEYRAANRDKLREQKAAYYKKNRTKILARQKVRDELRRKAKQKGG